ncbi:MAG: radical SAM protein [Candidatus Desulfofervidaceae bacterium]|nr:radical SAM protein [Candidatus Desulfofervidaceae bacterium]
MIYRERKSRFIRLFNKTPEGVICPHFYELILSNGCPFDCAYCYLKLTFRGDKSPKLFTNDWTTVQKELDAIDTGVFNTGELADSLAVIPPLLPKAIEYFQDTKKSKFLLLVTKSTNIKILEQTTPSKNIIISFSINAPIASRLYEKKAPSPYQRLEAAWRLKELGWRVRIRLDPIIPDVGLNNYKSIVKEIAKLKPEAVTLGMLRQFPGLYRFAPDAPRNNLKKAPDGRMRYQESLRVKTYHTIAEWLGFQPSLCKETKEVWRKLGWSFTPCNCVEPSILKEKITFTHKVNFEEKISVYTTCTFPIQPMVRPL